MSAPIPLNNVYALIKALQADLTAACSELRLPRPPKGPGEPPMLVPPDVLAFREPVHDARDRYAKTPFIALVPLNGSHRRGQEQYTIGIRIATWAPLEAGDATDEAVEADAFAVLDIVRARLLAAFSAPLNGVFRYSYEPDADSLAWERSPEQAPEYCELVMTASFSGAFGFH